MSLNLFTEAVPAIEALRRGELIDWQPGNGSRCEIALVRVGLAAESVLLCRLCHWVAPSPSYEHSLAHWIAAGLPIGMWSSYRPLFAALGWTGGVPVTDPIHDARREFEARAGDLRSAELPEEDAHNRVIGRVVRNLLAAEGFVVSASDLLGER